MNSTKPYEALVRKCWDDPEFKARLLKDPQAVLLEAGLPIPAGIKSITAIENSPQQLTIVIPPNPADMPDEKELIAGGFFVFTRGGFSCDFIVHNR
ncbi:NHLP leader peptide family natural product precursor [Orrella sp. NBD-18]|uniref:NHLP leader peptide family natural product n=1 Tax=Sheuella amnicola TaxID=2707330 RepID=A0A6B2R017_9BURK|nr:NHLP leader peptide family RiPP precursor [Sheuella amnicola]NDY83348.1 NHLP leader peptide family natural product precursor [Sheuella amnicola]HBI84025.1 NHLP leader peptide family natural product precursor [Alcaligenaceae bacterium]